MRVVTTTQSGSGGGLPFQNHDVREWSRVDRLTGALERARLETDHWTANTNNSSHKYGKVVDSRSLCAADGALQQQAKRQLEVFQSQIPGGRLQVIKTHTISSSRWTNNTTPVLSNADSIDRDFENLQLAVNSLDLTSQKSKANVVKSVARRPPSRTRSKNDETSTTSIPKVARLCRQVHEENLKQMTNNYRSTNKEKQTEEYKYPKLTRTKSSSSEDLNTTINEHEEQENNHLKRSSKMRLSLQLSKGDKSPVEFLENKGNVQRISQDFETNRRLNTALRGNSIDFVSLNKLWQSTSSPEKELKDDIPERQKRNSFVTAESLKEVREKLRRTSLSSNEKVEDIDDGIVAENTSLSELEDTKNGHKGNIRSYIYGMENVHNNKPNLGTGSLDSKSKFSLLNRNEDWYNRRKSYGFEKVTNENSNENSVLSKNNCDSSTDSGICKSTDVIIPESDTTAKTGSVKRFSYYFEQNGKNESDRSDIKTTIKIPLNVDNHWHNTIGDKSKRHSIAVDEYVLKNGNIFPKKPSSDKISNIIIVNNDNDNDFFQGKRSNKKVEFCKTEIHFAADSGKVNIVETDEKPPPTNNFRRRRKHLEFNNDDFKCDMPVLHFGDSSYEKTLLGLSDLDCIGNDKNFGHENQPVSLNNVTVNTTSNNVEVEDDDRKFNGENETRRGILKNKPIKPTPYHLGDNENRLLEASSENSSNIWDVKLRNVDKSRNSWTSTVSISDIDKNHNSLDVEKSRETEFQKLLKNLKPTNKNSNVLNDPLNSVYMVNKVSHQEIQNVHNGTKLSVADRIKQVEEMQSSSNRFSTKINFGNGEATVVENNDVDGYENAKRMTWPRSEHPTKDEVLSGRKTDDQNSDKTTTKIKIDMTSSNKTYKKSPQTNSKLPRSPVHTFKSPKLILNTIKADTDLATQSKPNVGSIDGIPKQLEALKMLYEDSQSDGENDKDWKHNQTQRKLEEAIDYSGSVASGSWSKMKTFKNITQQLNKTYKIQNRTGRVNSNNTLVEKGSLQEQNSLYSRVRNLDENATFNKETKEAETKYYENVSSVPLLTKLKIGVTSDRFSSPEPIEQHTKTSETITKSKTSRVSRSLQSEFDSRKSDIYSKLPKKGSVLRQPAKSEMAYFGVRVSPETTKIKKERPEQKITGTTNTALVTEMYKKEPPEYPIYENVKPAKYGVQDKKFDDSVLVELNKAADEILKSVKEATPEKTIETKPLDTIPEKKSWKKEKNEKVTLKHRCSTSSTNSTQRKSVSSKQSLDKTKKKIDESSSKAIKVRRLQRANSREALLQSHGSSSEDLGVNKEPPVRKPRQVKRTKTLTASNETVNKPSETKKTDTSKVKTNERIFTTKLPEIRHKTAVSTMRSMSGRNTNEKSDRSKRKMPQKKVAGIKIENDKEVDVKSIGSHHKTSVKAKKYQHSRE